MKTQLTPLDRFWMLLKPDQQSIRNLYTFAVLSGVISLSLPLGIQAIVNFIQGGQINASWILLVVLVVLGVAATGVLQIFQIRITEHIQQQIFTRAAFEFALRIPKIKWQHLYEEYAPELMNRFFDVLTLQKGLSKILLDLTTASLQVLFGLILLSFYHPFFILFGLTLIVLVYFIIRLTAKQGLETSLEESKHKYRLVYWLEELARTATTFKMAGETDFPIERSDRHVISYLDARQAHFGILIRQYALMVGFKVVIVAGLLIIGSVLVMNELMNIGQFIAAEIIILLVINSVEKLILSFDTIYDVLTALSKIGTVTDLELQPKSSALVLPEDPLGTSIKLDSVSFSYPGQQRKIFTDLNIELKSGEKVLIDGENSAGKSTFLRIISGLYQGKGSITYNSIPIRNWDMEQFWTVTGDALNHELLFHGTVKENITLGRKAATNERLVETIRNLHLTEFINQLPKGLEHVLDPEGRKLPEGVLQKLIIARAIIHNPALLILENSLEHLVGNEKESIIRYLSESHHNWTLLVVSNDHLWSQLVDRRIVLEAGKIIVDQNLRGTGDA